MIFVPKSEGKGEHTNVLIALAAVGCHASSYVNLGGSMRPMWKEHGFLSQIQIEELL